jgi:hypothetical protein
MAAQRAIDEVVPGGQSARTQSRRVRELAFRVTDHRRRLAAPGMRSSGGMQLIVPCLESWELGSTRRSRVFALTLTFIRPSTSRSDTSRSWRSSETSATSKPTTWTYAWCSSGSNTASDRHSTSSGPRSRSP